MLNVLLLTTSLTTTQLPTQDRVREALSLSARTQAKKVWPSPVPRPEGMVRFDGHGVTQNIYTSDGREVVEMVNVSTIKDADKWSSPGGLEGIEGCKSQKYRYIPGGWPAPTWVEHVRILNSSGDKQPQPAIVRNYPNETRFDEILIHNGKVFEHRMREKVDGKWRSRVLYRDRSSRPSGYTGLKVSCSSCHSEAGTGSYGEGMVPGGDTVISDPLDWTVWTGETSSFWRLGKRSY